MTLFLPEADRYSHSKRRLDSQIASLFGGRIAEEIIFGEESVTTGASNDIERATDIARNMVTRWGLSELGPLTYGEEEGEVFLGHSVSKRKDMSDDTARRIDEEIHKICDRNYNRAHKIIEKNMKKLHLMAEALLKYETIDTDQITDIMAGKEPKEPRNWSDTPEDPKDDPKSKVASKEAPGTKSTEKRTGPVGDPANES